MTGDWPAAMVLRPVMSAVERLMDSPVRVQCPLDSPAGR